MQPVEIRFVRQSEKSRIPSRQSPDAGAYDVYASNDVAIVVEPGKIAAIPTGISVEIPSGYILSVRPRSGLALKHGITLINSPGTIDSDYRGEIKILVINHGGIPYSINQGERIAQLILERTFDVKWIETDKLEATVRGENGFGSTGKY